LGEPAEGGEEDLMHLLAFHSETYSFVDIDRMGIGLIDVSAIRLIINSMAGNRRC
jgi:hypothetical protein